MTASSWTRNIGSRISSIQPRAHELEAHATRQGNTASAEQPLCYCQHCTAPTRAKHEQQADAGKTRTAAQNY